MSKAASVSVLTEGQSEQNFIRNVLAPYMGARNIFLFPIIVGKPGHKGGNIHFPRVKCDIANHLKQRSDTIVTFMLDYYGIDSRWPGYQESRRLYNHQDKVNHLMCCTVEALNKELNNLSVKQRVIPYFSMHELEALYFSNIAVLAEELATPEERIAAILQEFGDPEAINDNVATAPSKRLERLNKRFKKTVTGIAIAKKIGVERMRYKCHLFNCWLQQLEDLVL